METQANYTAPKPESRAMHEELLLFACRLLADDVRQMASECRRWFDMHNAFPVGLSKEPNDTLVARQQQVIKAHAAYLMLCCQLAYMQGKEFCEEDYAVLRIVEGEDGGGG
jgi:uncharacterized membrane protein YjdF